MLIETDDDQDRCRLRPVLTATEANAEVVGRRAKPSSPQLTALSTSPESLRLDQAFPPQAAALAPHGRPAALAITVVRDRAGFDALEPQWNVLLAGAGRDTHLFQTFNWNWHWANHYLSAAAQPATTSLAIVTAHRQGRLIALWPLVLVRCGGLKVLRWMGEPVSQYGDVLVAKLPDKAAVLRQCWRYIVDHLGADAAHLRKVRADADICAAARQPRPHRARQRPRALSRSRKRAGLCQLRDAL